MTTPLPMAGAAASSNALAAPNPAATATTATRRAEPRVARFVLSEPPRLVTSILLNEKWDLPLFTLDACRLDTICCLRCHLVSQANLVRVRPLHDCVLPLVVAADVLTCACPIGFYSGIGTVALGCYTRTQIRLRYRLQSTGFRDCLLSMCCSHCMVRQQEREMEKEGVQYHHACAAMQ